MSKEPKGWFVHLESGSTNCKVYYNGEPVEGVARVKIEMDLAMEVPSITLELSGSQGGLGFSAKAPSVKVND